MYELLSRWNGCMKSRWTDYLDKLMLPILVESYIGDEQNSDEQAKE